MTEKKKNGRPSHKPTAEQRKLVTDLVLAGMPQKEIAEVLDIGHMTLKEHYKDELSKNKWKRLNGVAKNIYKWAMEENCRASAFFIMKTQGGWREVSRMEHTGEDGGGIKVQVTIGGLDEDE